MLIILLRKHSGTCVSWLSWSGASEHWIPWQGQGRRQPSTDAGEGSGWAHQARGAASQMTRQWKDFCPLRRDKNSITHRSPLLTGVCLHFWYLIDYKHTRNPQGALSLCWGSRLAGVQSESEGFVAEMYSKWPRSGRLCDAQQHTLDDS